MTLLVQELKRPPRMHENLLVQRTLKTRAANWRPAHRKTRLPMRVLAMFRVLDQKGAAAERRQKLDWAR